MDDAQVAGLRARLVETEERLDRIGRRMTAGYGSDSDREGWLLWLRQLTAERDRLRRELGEEAGVARSDAGTPPPRAGARRP
jgi:hypothetical protein